MCNVKKIFKRVYCKLPSLKLIQLEKTHVAIAVEFDQQIREGIYFKPSLMYGVCF